MCQARQSREYPPEPSIPDDSARSVPENVSPDFKYSGGLWADATRAGLSQHGRDYSEPDGTRREAIAQRHRSGADSN